MAKSYSASPHCSRHFTHWHYLAARTAKPTFYTWSYFYFHSTHLADCYVIVPDDRYEPIIVTRSYYSKIFYH